MNFLPEAGAKVGRKWKLWQNAAIDFNTGRPGLHIISPALVNVPGKLRKY